MAKNYEKMASEIVKELNWQQQLMADIKKSSERVEKLRMGLKDSYPKFIDECKKSNSNIFVNIEKFPTTEEIRSYYQYGSPNLKDLMYEYGWFKIDELAVIIKLLYSLKKQKDYNIVTLANINIEYNGPTEYDMNFIPYMNFLIGPNETLKYLEEYNGKYFEKLSMEGNVLDIFKATRHQDLVRLIQRGEKEKALGINFEIDDSIENYLKYYDNTSHCPNYAYFPSEYQYNIFNNNFREIVRKLDKDPRSKVCSLLSFSVDLQDAFIARVLFSIVIHKYKKNIYNLSNDDYKYIFYELFKSDIDVLEVVDKEIPKVLTRYK